jgi:hypothetical protein
MNKGNFSGKFLITYDDHDELSKNLKNETVPGRRATISIELSEFSDFLKHEVILNEISARKASYDKFTDRDYWKSEKDEIRGKDVMINWDFLDGFNSGGKFFLDSNSLDMHEKELWKRQEFKMNETSNVAANFYPVSSAIAIRDTNSDKQVTIATTHVMGGSAGLRNGKNIELMHNRRFNIFDSYGLDDTFFEADSQDDTKGSQTESTYYLQIFNHKDGISEWGSLQKQLEMPPLVLYTKSNFEYNDFIK